MAGTLDGLRGIQAGRNLRIKPYVSTSGSTVGQRPTQGDFDGGVDVKYGVTPGLVWDFTVNTDFSQVEADEQQVNLTRFSLFFPEKRDFFLENVGMFDFGSTGGGGGGGFGAGAVFYGSRLSRVPQMRLFFSRRIGLSDEGQAIPIVAGTRLSGRAGAYSVGAMNIQQGDTPGVESANVTALRVRRDILTNSDIGAVLLNKDEAGPSYNRMAGVDANFRFGFLTLNGVVARSMSAERPVQMRATSTQRAALRSIRTARGSSAGVWTPSVASSRTSSASCRSAASMDSQPMWPARSDPTGFRAGHARAGRTGNSNCTRGRRMARSISASAATTCRWSFRTVALRRLA